MLTMRGRAQHAAAHSIYEELLMRAGDEAMYRDDGGNERLVERLRHERATASTAAGTWEEERAHLQASLDAAAAQRGNAFTALEATRQELEESAAALLEATRAAAAHKAAATEGFGT